MPGIKSDNTCNSLRTAGVTVGAGTAGYLMYKGIDETCHKPMYKMVSKLLGKTDNSIFKDAAEKACFQELGFSEYPETLLKEFQDDILSKYVNISKGDILKYKYANDCVLEYEPIGKLRPIGAKKIENEGLGLKKCGATLVNKFYDIKGGLATKFFKNREKQLLEVINGVNACQSGGRVCANFDKAAITVFHEIGHAKNYSSIGLGKVLQALRRTCVGNIGILAAFAGAVFISKQSDTSSSAEEDKGFLSKTKRFLKKNCVGIAALSCAPMVLEEGLASIKGGHLAKQFLSKDACKTLNRLNAKAWISYVMYSVALISGVFVADKVKNLLSNKEYNKQA